ncbi:MAG: RIP metalloprotease RseP [Verrucomicrobiales bacterium]|nr:RIP metalloprotease RseP [Verrucomicrobiales bacterium]
MELLLSILRFIGIIFLVLMVFNLMIIVHEWGHFLAGRWRGLYIDRFQIWFGKPLWKKTYNGVQYGLGSIPAGGFVSLPQMAPMESIEGKVDESDEPKKDLPPITPLDKIIVAVAGPVFSFLLALVFAVVVWAVKKPVSESVGTTTIGGVVENSPAETAGIKPGDKITFVDGKQVERFQGMDSSIMWTIISSENDNIEVDLVRPGVGEMTVTVKRPAAAEVAEVEGDWLKKTWAYVSKRPPLRTIGVYPQVSPVVGRVLENSPAEAAGLEAADIIKAIDDTAVLTPIEVGRHHWKAGETVTLTVLRNNEEIKTKITPRIPEVGGEKPMLGVVWDAEGVRTLVRENPLTQVANSFNSIVKTLGAVFSPRSDVSAGHLSGPVGIMGLYYDLFQHEEGWRLALWFSVLLNVNLAILNMLPFPVLDGGHIVMASVEWVRKRPIPFKVLEVVQTAFVLFLLGFMAFVTLKDVGDRVPEGNGGGELPKETRFLPLDKDSA